MQQYSLEGKAQRAFWVDSRINGKLYVVTSKSTAKAFFQDFYNSEQKADPETEKIMMVESAAKLIKSDIKRVETPYKDHIQSLMSLNLKTKA